MGSTRNMGIVLTTLGLLAANCGVNVGSTTGPVSVATSSLDEPFQVVDVEHSLEEVDLEAEAEALSPCIPEVAESINRLHFGSYLVDEIPKLDWSVAVGPFDIGDRELKTDVDFAERTDLDLAILDGDPRDLGISELLSGSPAATITKFRVRTVVFDGWPADGTILIGTRGDAIDLAFAVFENGLAALGFCNSGFSARWNPAVDELELGSPLDAADLLLTNPADERLQDALDLRPYEPPVEWVDQLPTERTYNRAPIDIQVALETADIVVYVAPDWNLAPGGVCSRTPEALHECTGYSVTKVLSNGEPGWIQRVAVVPGQPVTLFLSDELGGTVDLVELSPAMFANAAQEDLAILVDLRMTMAASPSELITDAELRKLLEISLVQLPEPVIASPTKDDGP